MRERAKRIGARLEFWSEAGAGTEVELSIPASIKWGLKDAIPVFPGGAPTTLFLRVTMKGRTLARRAMPLAQIIPIGTFIVALVALYLTRQQRKNEKAKLRLDAYPKQIEIFRCTERFLSRTWADQNAYMPTLLADFHNCTKEARFLFDKEMAGYLDDLYKGVDRHFYLETKLEIEGEAMSSDEKRILQDQVFGSRRWVGQQNMQLKERFAKYIDLGGLQ
jgi:hypothetical protein